MEWIFLKRRNARALFFATQPGGSPRCVAFFCEKMEEKKWTRHL